MVTKEEEIGFCATCQNFVPNTSQGKDFRGYCHFYPNPLSVTNADMHWCRLGYVKGEQRTARSSITNPKGLDEKPKSQEVK